MSKVKHMEKYDVLKRTKTEIVFASIEHLQGFFDQVSNGSWVVIEYIKDKTKFGEVISPDISAEIRDRKVTISSEEKV